MEFNILVKNRQGEVMAEHSGNEECCLVYKDAYLHGDRIVFKSAKSPVYVVATVDDAITDTLVYMKQTTFEFEIPFDEKKLSYSPKSFSGNLHMIHIRLATEDEITRYANLAVNTLDQHENNSVFPHAYANVETRGESVFAARNAIDGNRENHSHGNWPYESWGINMQEDAQLTIDFGRVIHTNKIVLYTRADFPHDNWWTNVTFTFSDGTELEFEMEKSDLPHVCEFPEKQIEWLKLGKLMKSCDPSLFPALSQIEVYGKNQREL